jgi:hypothetical protein
MKKKTFEDFRNDLIRLNILGVTLLLYFIRLYKNY